MRGGEIVVLPPLKSCYRLLTAERDKTIKVYTEDEEATPGTHPLNWKPPKKASVTLSDATQIAISEGAQPSAPEDEEALAALGPGELARFFSGNEADGLTAEAMRAKLRCRMLGVE